MVRKRAVQGGVSTASKWQIVFDCFEERKGN
jgi:hypothetical protein